MTHSSSNHLSRPPARASICRGATKICFLNSAAQKFPALLNITAPVDLTFAPRHVDAQSICMPHAAHPKMPELAFLFASRAGAHLVASSSVTHTSFLRRERRLHINFAPIAPSVTFLFLRSTLRCILSKKSFFFPSQIRRKCWC